jgi:hypothetical protein
LSVTVEIKNLQYESCVEQRDEASGLFFKWSTVYDEFDEICLK